MPHVINKLNNSENCYPPDLTVLYHYIPETKQKQTIRQSCRENKIYFETNFLQARQMFVHPRQVEIIKYS